MMMEETYQTNSEIQEGNITSLWYKDIYESLRKIQDYERICKDGAVGIIEYLQVEPHRVAEIQHQMLRSIVTELNILLGNVKILLPEHFFIITMSKIKIIIHNLDYNPQMFLSAMVNQQNHTTQYQITFAYIETLRTISKIREELVVNLTNILFGRATEKGSGMDKTLTSTKKELIR